MQSADQVTGAICEWISSRFPDTAVAVADAPPTDGKPVIRIALADLFVESSVNRRTPATLLQLDYHISVEAADPLVVHRYLGEIAFALAESPALGGTDAAPLILRMERCRAERPCIAVATTLLRPLSRPSAPPVRHAPVLHVGAMGTIEGIVEGPDGAAVAGVVVELPALRLAQTTGPDGRFRFDAPSDAAGSIEVTARKQRFRNSVVAQPGKHLKLQLSMES